MKTIELLNLLEKIGPLSISDEFCKKHGLYDNSGIIVDCGEQIKGVLFSLDLSKNAIDQAKKQKLNCIVTHHPAIYGGISSLSVSDPSTYLIAQCLFERISVISMHLNFDAAPEGIDYHLMKGLGGSVGNAVVTLSNGAYGRVYDVAARKFGEYFENVKETFKTQRAIAYGDTFKTVKRVASFCGAGCDDVNMNFAKAEGADVFVSSDLKHHQITALLAQGINVIILTHYAAENYGFNKIFCKIIDGLNIPSAYYCDEGLL